MWTALMFDTAAMTFGRYIEAKMEERDEQGNRINTLERLLDLPDRRSPVERNRETLARLKQAARNMRGGEIVYLS